jgi:hypothetical protein
MFRLLFWLTTALLGLPNTAAAQAVGPSEDTPPAIAAREQAKVAFVRDQASTRDLARARLDAARTELQVRSEMYRAGSHGVTLELLVETAERVLRAALELSENQAERRAALEGYCSLLRFAERITAAKYSVGRIYLATYESIRGIRLQGEMRLSESGARAEEPILPPEEEWWISRPAPLAFGLGRFASMPDLDEERAEETAHAREKFAAVSTPRRELARMRRDSARTELREGEEYYRAGDPGYTLDLLVKSSAKLLDAEFALSDQPADRLAALSRHWLYVWAVEQITETASRAGRVTLGEVMEVRRDRLGVEVKLAEARAGQGLSGPVPMAPVLLVPEGSAENFAPCLVVPLLITREMAKSQFEAGRAAARDLALARRDAARVCQQEQWENYQTGASGAPVLFQASRKLLEAELAVLDDPAERVAARERYWEQTRIVEDVQRAKYEVGRVSLADVMQISYERLDAEIRLAEARAKLKGD